MGQGLSIGFFGAAGEVTGSRHLLSADGARILLDCGLFQGHRQQAIDKNRSFPFAPESLSDVVLSHAHIDHTGCLPLLFKAGARAPVHCTPVTGELAALMLLDSAHLQEADARFFNKLHAHEGRSISALYGEEDVRQCLRHLAPCALDQTVDLGAARLRLSNSGHVLGSAMVQIDVRGRRILFTGDLGRRKSLLMQPPSPQAADYLIIESTYGGRAHAPLQGVAQDFAAVLQRAAAQKGKVLIPTFALERTQEIVFILEKLRRDAAAPAVPIYVDSPMAVAITDIFSRHLQDRGLSSAFQDYAARVQDPFGAGDIHYVRTKEQSQALNDLPGPMVILSASGMCEGGRILHHLRHNIDRASTTILLVGHQAEGTLGRQLQDGASRVSIFGLEHEVAAKVETLHAFSSHADKDDLLAFISSLDPAPRKIFLVHGDPQQRGALAQALQAEGVRGVACPEFGETCALD